MTITIGIVIALFAVVLSIGGEETYQHRVRRRERAERAARKRLK